MKLPEEAQKVNLGRLPEGIVYFIYGDPKVGKSTLASRFPNPLFLATEPGLSGLDGIYQLPISDAGDISEAYRLLAADGAAFRTIVIDTVDRFAEIIQGNICRKLGVSHPADLGYGRGWYEVRQTVMAWLLRFFSLGGTLVLISHARERIDETGHRPPRIVPSLSNSLAEMILSWSDVILYCRIDTDDDGQTVHRLKSRGSSLLTAGSRFPQLRDDLDMSFAAIKSCFNGGKRKTSSKKRN